MLTKKTQILFKAESPNGTWNAPGVGDGALAYDVVATPEFNMFKRDPQHSGLSRYQSLSGQQSATITFKIAVRGSGDDTNPPDNWVRLFTACGMTTTSGDITTNSDAITTLSMQIEEDGVHKTFVGCGGNVRIVGTVGEPVFFEFTFRGTIRDITSGALSTLTGIPSTVPPVLLSASFATNVGGSESHLISAIEFDLQNEIALRADVNVATGVKSSVRVNRNPVGSFDPEYNTTYDWLDDVISNTLGTLTLDVGSTSQNKCQITAPQIRFLSMDPGDREGIRILTVPFEMNRSSGNDEINLDWNF